MIGYSRKPTVQMIPRDILVLTTPFFSDMSCSSVNRYYIALFSLLKINPFKLI